MDNKNKSTEFTAKEWTAKESGIFCNNKQIAVISLIDRGNNPEHEINAKIICNAINNTVLKGINPSDIPDVLNTLVKITDIKTRDDVRTENGGLITCYQIPYTLIDEAVEALKNITLKTGGDQPTWKELAIKEVKEGTKQFIQMGQTIISQKDEITRLNNELAAKNDEIDGLKSELRSIAEDEAGADI